MTRTRLHTINHVKKHVALGWAYVSKLLLPQKNKVITDRLGRANEGSLVAKGKLGEH